VARAIHFGESLVAGVRRVLLEQLDEVVRAMQAPELSDDAVHDIRKSLKRARASLRLLRDSRTDASYRRDNALLRDAARPLTPLRDAKILVELVHELGEESESRRRTKYRQLRRDLQRRRRRMRPQLSADLERSASKVMRVLHSRASSPLRACSVRLDPLAGFERSYKRARKAFAKARKTPRDTQLHELRKRVKDVLYQVEMLRPALEPGRAKRVRKQADAIASCLGDDHDLAVLANEIGSGTLERNRRAKLQRRADRMAERLLREKPTHFAKRVTAPRS
jgi:CHAD domain-containing protein